MRLLHKSDCHSTMPALQGNFNCVVDSGDFFPNSRHVFHGERDKEVRFQMQWLQDNIEDLKKQLAGRDLLFVAGNHDFVDPIRMEALLQSEGINAIDLTNKLVSYGGINFYGFPYVPTINGDWNYERAVPEMQQEVRRMVDVINSNQVDVLACHCPIYGCLDLTTDNDRIGNRVMADALDYQIEDDKKPSYYLCGHCHNPGITMRGKMLVSNMATSQCVIEI